MSWRVLSLDSRREGKAFRSIVRGRCQCCLLERGQAFRERQGRRERLVSRRLSRHAVHTSKGYSPDRCPATMQLDAAWAGWKFPWLDADRMEHSLHNSGNLSVGPAIKFAGSGSSQYR